MSTFEHNFTADLNEKLKRKQLQELQQQEDLRQQVEWRKNIPTQQKSKTKFIFNLFVWLSIVSWLLVLWFFAQRAFAIRSVDCDTMVTDDTTIWQKKAIKADCDDEVKRLQDDQLRVDAEFKSNKAEADRIRKKMKEDDEALLSDSEKAPVEPEVAVPSEDTPSSEVPTEWASDTVAVVAPW